MPKGDKKVQGCDATGLMDATELETKKMLWVNVCPDEEWWLGFE